MNVALPEGQTFQGGSLASRYASFVKLPHTLFALPFAGVGALLASYEYADRINLSMILWILIAFTAARFAAMGFNRIADRHHDARNPRTQMRELPSGKLSIAQAWMAVVFASALFVFASFRLNSLCGWLSPVALAWVFFYSYTKRFTSFAHLVLGLSLGIAPVGAYLAISGEWSEPASALVLIAAGVMCWVAGFDVIYALQDLEFDRQHKLHSIPTRVGPDGALRVARALHLMSVAAFAAVIGLQLFPVGWLYSLGLGVMVGLLFYEHRLLAGTRFDQLDLKTIDKAFFRVNVMVSTSFFVCTLLDRLLLA
ncbi:MAG TPA: UbiA-like polyprenyltransferase [Longimicrobiales bacterium]